MTDNRDGTGVVLTPETLGATAAAVTGGINVQVKVGTTTYTLSVSLSEPYTFTLSDGTSQLADIVVKDDANFKVQVGMPPVTSGDMTISGGFLVQEGTPS